MSVGKNVNAHNTNFDGTRRKFMLWEMLMCPQPTGKLAEISVSTTPTDSVIIFKYMVPVWLKPPVPVWAFSTGSLISNHYPFNMWCWLCTLNIPIAITDIIMMVKIFVIMDHTGNLPLGL